MFPWPTLDQRGPARDFATTTEMKRVPARPSEITIATAPGLFVQVRGHFDWLWRVEDSSLRSFRDGFTDHSDHPRHPPGLLLGVPAISCGIGALARPGHPWHDIAHEQAAYDRTLTWLLIINAGAFIVAWVLLAYGLDAWRGQRHKTNAASSPVPTAPDGRPDPAGNRGNPTRPTSRPGA